eukprot:TRINITY_DN2224_c0_g1_i2.p1 TRINITY_DN2224_c0_g1~~TRINITY_DN2224_c0_g1_i2.p1  ORF type:complete len:150 (-),score=43.97 TRINITY_DN2224_c0_g1_i2:402-851(-)
MCIRDRVSTQSTGVKFPLTDLDLSDYISSPDVSTPPIYDLYAISNHYGSLGGGHYTAFAKNRCTNHWYKFDDSSVSEVSSDESVITPAAYILFYKRKDVQQHFSQSLPNESSSSSSSTTSTTTTSSTPTTTVHHLHHPQTKTITFLLHH